MSDPVRDIECELHGDCAAFVLRALGEEEARVFQAHLADCLACRAEVARLQVVADALAVEVQPLRAPATLRERVLAAVGVEAELLETAGSEAAGPGRDTRPWVRTR